MKKILIPIDGSSISLKAVLEAKKLAEAFNSEIVLLTVANITTPSGIEESNLDIKAGLELQKYVSKFKINAEKHLAEAKISLGDLGPKAESVILYGDPAEQIANYLDDHDVDFVVIGSQGLGVSRFRQVFIGSVTSKILRHAKQPILIVK
ncbi:MAG: universal stress protein [Acetobacterium sp.]